jgi:GT2 family glycosyltransferase
VNRSRCAVGLLSWNGERDIAACVRSLAVQSEPDLEIRWIDNGSTDATIERAAAANGALPEPRRLARNVGFCAGHNLGLAETESPYYLALNQDAILAPDYIARLCDWMDEDASLAMASGLILEMGERGADLNAPIASAGMAMGRGRFPFELAKGRAPDESTRARRIVPGVTGAAMMLRRSAMDRVADAPGEVFPAPFFAYFEEVDLALRVARAGMKCGVEGAAVAWHASRGLEGARSRELRAHYLKNHWLVTLRNDAWREMLADFPAILLGEAQWFAPRYFKTPRATVKAALATLRLAPEARRRFRASASANATGREGRAEFYRLSREMLQAEKSE